MTPKMEAIARFARLRLKQPLSKIVLQAILEKPSFIERLTFVEDREFLANTLLISEHGSDRVGFELELGARQLEQVNIVNGHLVRQVHRTSSVRIHDPAAALGALAEFKGRLYVSFCFANDPPPWYVNVIEPNPALPPPPDGKETLAHLLDDIVRQQIDLALLAILLRNEIDQALDRRDRQAFAERAKVYRAVVSRCLWQL